MKIIVNAEPEDMEAVVRMVMKARADFDRHPERIGWGWHFSYPGGATYFVRQIKGGLSASPAEKGLRP